MRHERLESLAVLASPAAALSSPTSAAGSGRRCRRRASPTRAPSCASASAKFTATVDLPTPPLPEATAIRLSRARQRLQAVLHGVRDDRARRSRTRWRRRASDRRAMHAQRLDERVAAGVRAGSRTRIATCQPSGRRSIVERRTAGRRAAGQSAARRRRSRCCVRFELSENPSWRGDSTKGRDCNLMRSATRSRETTERKRQTCDTRYISAKTVWHNCRRRIDHYVHCRPCRGRPVAVCWFVG